MKIAVVGTGHWGKNHARVLRDLRKAGDVDEFVICDADASRAKSLAESFDAPYVTDYRRVLEDASVDGVILATPTPTHYPLARDAVDAGKDVLVEKPMTLTYAESLDLVAHAERAGRLIGVGHIFRYHAGVNEVRRLIKAGDFGRILYITSNRQAFREPRRDMGVMHALGVHEVDLFCYLLGHDWPQTLWATSAAYHYPGIEETSYIHMTFPGNVHCHAFESWLSPTQGKDRHLIVVGERQSAHVDYLKPDEVRIHDAQIVEREVGDTVQFVARDDGARVVRVQYEEPLEAEIRDFLRAIRTREPPVADMHAGARAVRMVEAALAMGTGAGAARFE